MNDEEIFVLEPGETLWMYDQPALQLHRDDPVGQVRIRVDGSWQTVDLALHPATSTQDPRDWVAVPGTGIQVRLAPRAVGLHVRRDPA